jgi:LmbE family N-acetylglucosaminyl deacetylase
MRKKTVRFRHFVDVTDVFDSKISAMECFSSQLKFSATRSIETLE